MLRRIEVGLGLVLAAVGPLGWYVHPVAYVSLAIGIILIAHGVYEWWAKGRNRPTIASGHKQTTNMQYPKWWVGSRAEWDSELEILEIEKQMQTGVYPSRFDLQEELAERWRRLGKLPSLPSQSGSHISERDGDNDVPEP